MTVTRFLQIEVPFNTKLTFFIHPLFVFPYPLSHHPFFPLMNIFPTFRVQKTFISFPQFISYSLPILFLKFLFKFSNHNFPCQKFFFFTTPRAKSFTSFFREKDFLLLCFCFNLNPLTQIYK